MDVFGVRHVQVMMAFFAVTLAYILRLNLSVAIVAMTDKSNANPNYPILPWNESEKSQVLSAFFWGYFWLQIAVGNFAEKFGSKKLLFFGMTMCSILTIIIPLLASYGYFLVCILRLLEGLFQGVFFPCCTVLISKWTPFEERKRALTITYSGSNVGPLIGLSLAGFLASGFGGWSSIFYVTGGLGCAWALAWLWIGASTPSEHRFIKAAERDFINDSLTNASDDKEKLATPWRQIATSTPLWAILISHLGQNWGYWTLATQIPNYINDVLHVDIKKNGVFSCLPYLAGWVTAILFSWISDHINKRGLISKNLERKMWNCIGLWGPALSLLVLGILKVKNEYLVVTLLAITLALNSGIYCGFLTNHVALSPNHCGTLMGITNSIASVTSILGPLCVGWIVPDKTEDQWKNVFYLSSVIMFGANSFYVIFGSSDVQEWNNSSPRQNSLSQKNVSSREYHTLYTIQQMKNQDRASMNGELEKQAS